MSECTGEWACSSETVCRVLAPVEAQLMVVHLGCRAAHVDLLVVLFIIGDKAGSAACQVHHIRVESLRHKPVIIVVVVCWFVCMSVSVVRADQVHFFLGDLYRLLDWLPATCVTDYPNIRTWRTRRLDPRRRTFWGECTPYSCTWTGQPPPPPCNPSPR